MRQTNMRQTKQSVVDRTGFYQELVEILRSSPPTYSGALAVSVRRFDVA